MITVLLLIIIYLAFISLGLPDSLLGVTLPAIQEQWGIPLSFGGVVSIVGITGAVLSSLFSSILVVKWGTGRITLFSCLLTAVSLLGISFAPGIFWIILLAFPLGIGGGAVDAALNNYVALHFKARHMNWLHCFWGIGATLGPVIMSLYIEETGGWRLGYRFISSFQFFLATLLLLSLGLWKCHQSLVESDTKPEPPVEKKSILSYFSVLKQRGVGFALLTMMLYCSLEFAVGLWGSNFLVRVKDFTKDNAALWAAFYYGGITVGRFLSGFVSFRLNNLQLIRLGILLALAGIVILLFPLPAWITGAAFVLIGLGFSPVFPAMLHQTPIRFGSELSQKIMGFQMGFGYTAGAVLPALLGAAMHTWGLRLFPVILLTWLVLMLFSSEAIELHLKSGIKTG